MQRKKNLTKRGITRVKLETIIYSNQKVKRLTLCFGLDFSFSSLNFTPMRPCFLATGCCLDGLNCNPCFGLSSSLSSSSSSDAGLKLNRIFGLSVDEIVTILRDILVNSNKNDGV